MRIRWGGVLAWLCLALGAAYFFVPLLATADFSLRARKDVLSLLAYRQVLEDPLFAQTFSFSIMMALLTVVASIALVVPTVYWVHMYLPRLRGVLEFVTLLPMVIPAVVVVFGLLRVYGSRPLSVTSTAAGTDLLLLGGYVVLALPYTYRAVDVGLRALDVRTLTEAAQSLGAGWGTIIFRIILPNLRAALLSGAFLTVAIVIGEFTIASFLVGLKAFGPYMWSTGQYKAYESAALAIISFGLTWASMGLIQLFNRGAPGREQLAGTR
jgi:putative spermidine/putrescine transport system permease protein